jgi:phosphate transport system substrate-binding protein
MLKPMPEFSCHARYALIATVAAVGLAAPALADPAHVIVSLPDGAALPADLAPTLSKWRQSGDVADVLWLSANQQQNAGFNTFVELDFPSEADYQKWAAKDAPALRAPLEVHKVNALVHGETLPRDSNYSTFQVDMFQATGGEAALKGYANDILKPLMDSERAKKNVLRYTLYDEAEPGGQTKAWILTEYRDPASFARAAALPAPAAGTRGLLTLARYEELPPPNLTDLPSYQAVPKLNGTLRIYGSELKNAVEYLAKGFQEYQPDVKVTWSSATSSEGAIAGLYTGVSDVAPMGDDAKLTDEMPFYNVTGYLPTEISVATGGYEKRGSLWAWAIVVNKNNPLNEISMDELERVFGAERSGGWKVDDNDWLYTAEYARDKSSNLRTWGQLDLHGPYAKREILTYGYSAPGFETAIERHWFHWSHKWNPNFMEYVEQKEAVSGPLGKAVWSERPLEVISKNPYAIGIAGIMHVKDYPDLKVLKVSWRKGGPYIPLTPETVANRTYPLIRDAYFYVNKAPGQPLNPIVQQFMRFVLSREGQEIIAKVNYYYPLDRNYLEQQRKKLD